LDRRREPRVPVNLNATVVNDKVLPIGCRVGNVSSTGMLLRHEGGEDHAKIEADDEVEVRVSLKQNDERKVVQLPLTVVRQSENSLGGRFPQAQPELMELVEPYRTADPETVIPLLTTAANQQLELPEVPETLGQAQETASPAAPAAQDKAEKQKIDDRPAAVHTSINNRFFAPTAISLIVLLAGLNVYLLQELNLLEARVVTLESQNAQLMSQNSVQTPSAAPIQTTTQEPITSEIFDKQLTALKVQNQALESRIFLLEAVPSSRQEQPPAIAPITNTPAPAESSLANNLPQRTGDWVINLLSVHNEKAAYEFAQQARAEGIAADVRPEIENQDQVWRVQVSGFTSRAEAGAFSVNAQETLGLSSVWIFKSPN